MTARVIEMPTRTDHRGSLSVIEAIRDCPFPIERVFYLHGAPAGATRGQHAHRELQQLIVVVHGSVDVGIDDGTTVEQFAMHSPTTGLFVPELHWTRLANFSADAVAIVLASAPFDEADYILTYPEFQELTRGGR